MSNSLAWSTPYTSEVSKNVIPLLKTSLSTLMPSSTGRGVLYIPVSPMQPYPNLETLSQEQKNKKDYLQNKQYREKSLIHHILDGFTNLLVKHQWGGVALYLGTTRFSGI